MNPFDPYISIDQFDYNHGNTVSSLTDTIQLSLLGDYSEGVLVYEGLRLTFSRSGTDDGTPEGTNTGNTITINFADPLTVDEYNTREISEGIEGNIFARNIQNFLGETGLILDPHYDSNVIIFDDLI